MIEFHDTHRDNLPRLPVSVINPLTTIMALGRDAETAKLIHTTPEFRVLVFRAWVRSFYQPQPDRIRGTSPMGNFCVYIHDFPLDIASEHDFEEAVEGSGGSKICLPRLRVKHLQCVVQFLGISCAAYSLRPVVSLIQQRCQVDSSFRQDHGIILASGFLSNQESCHLGGS